MPILRAPVSRFSALAPPNHPRCRSNHPLMNSRLPMITPSLKVKRRVVWQKYGPQIEALYNDAPAKEKQASQAAS